jgi:hypothetical protein
MARRKDPLTETSVEAAAEVSEPAPTPEATMPLGDEPAAAPPELPPAPEPAMPEPPAPPPRRAGMIGPLLGGALAALGGFGLSHFNVLGLVGPDQTAAVAALDNKIDALAAAQAEQGQRLQTLGAETEKVAGRVATLESLPAPDAPDLSRLDDLETRLQVIEALPADGQASTAALAAKLAELERQLASRPAVADQAEVDAALARLAEAEAEAGRRADEAAAAAASVAKAGALDRLREAAATGAGFEAELAALEDPTLQAALASHVAGVATLDQLRADFPEAARLALQLARAGAEGEGWGARALDFLAAQTGARSLTPREGNDPDAMLSRAEFALGEGRLADALAEVKALDPAIRAPFDDWVARAEARLAVNSVLEAL